MPNIPKGAIRVHLYDFKDVLRPRGPMEKESLSLDIFERLQSIYESWTDEKYGDNPDEMELVRTLYSNLMGEVNAAYEQFVKYYTTKKTKAISKDS